MEHVIINQILQSNYQYFVQFKEEDFTMRTPEVHDYHCSLLDGALANSDSVTYGITSKSSLNEIPHFHLPTMLPQDVMHILFEGVVPRELKLMLANFIETKKHFSLDELNGHFSYGRSEARNKPPKA